MYDSESLIEPPTFSKLDVEKIVGTKINNLELYRRAFTHKSALKMYTLTESFETLEFMGDSVLGFVITKWLFDKYESKQEGFLTKARTRLVRGRTLSHIARKLNLDRWVLMDEKGIRNGWNRNDKILEDTFEALIGAIYLDLGLLHAKKFILSIFENPQFIDINCIMIDDNHKDRLMRYCQTNKLIAPQYPINYHQNGTFNVSVVVCGAVRGQGCAKNKKEAEQIAASEALQALNLEN